MRALQTLSFILSSLSLLDAVYAQSAENAVTVHVWPLESSAPQQLAQISYNPYTLSSTVSQLALPKGSHKSEDLVRVGLYDSKTSEWRGVVTSATSFDTRYQQKISLHVDDDGSVWHIGFSAYPKPSTVPNNVNGVPQVLVEILKPTQGPQPILNRPVVLTADGKVQEKEPEKSFLQKYWWIIGIVLLMQVMAAGGGDSK